MRQDSSINRMKHFLSIFFEKGKLKEITSLDTRNIPPQYKQLVACPSTFPVSQMINQNTRLKFQKVRTVYGRKYVEDIVYYTFSGVFCESTKPQET